MSKMMTKSEAEKICTCGSCPSYAKCDESWAFCLSEESGKSRCITVERGCICPSCPAQGQTGFTNQFYCTKGSQHSRVGKFAQ